MTTTVGEQDGSPARFGVVESVGQIMRVPAIVLFFASTLGGSPHGSGGAAIGIDAARLGEAVSSAAPHSVLVADRDKEVTVSETVVIDRPLTLVGLNMRLAAGLAKTPILSVESEHVRIRDFTLTGNGDSVPQSDRAPLIVVRRGRFVIENGETNNSAKDGVMINPTPEFGDIEHGVVRNLTAKDTIRDVVSISGMGNEGLFVRHLVVENIRSYGSRLRGPVEVSDGSEHITVRDVYAESSFYGVDVQDHGKEGMVNRAILIDGVQVRDCVTAIRTANRDFGHDGLTIRNVSGEAFRPSGRQRSLHVRNTRNVVIENVKIAGGPKDLPWIAIENSDNVALRNVTLTDASQAGPAVVVEDADNALLDNIVFAGRLRPERGIEYRVRSDERFAGLRIRNVMAQGTAAAGIVLANLSQSGGLDSYAITDNLATVQAEMESPVRLVRGNL